MSIASTRARVVLLGMGCRFTEVVLATLLREEVDVVGVGVAKSSFPPQPPALELGDPPLAERGEPQGFGFQKGGRESPSPRVGPGTRWVAAGFPSAEETAPPSRFALARLDAAAIATIAAHRPDAVVVACFPWRLPEALLAAPRLGCLNVHPSLLPVGRGPEPVFWTLRRGERQTGATVHRMDAGFDTGPILAQTAIATPAGVRAAALEARLAALGGRLAARALADLAAGTARPVPQDDAGATAAPVPGPEDWVVPTNLPARWAFNFARGVAGLGGPLTLLVGATGERFALRDALGCDDGATLDAPSRRDGDALVVRFRPGVATFALADQAPR